MIASIVEVKLANFNSDPQVAIIIEKVTRGKKPPVNLLEHIYGLSFMDFLDQH